MLFPRTGHRSLHQVTSNSFLLSVRQPCCGMGDTEYSGRPLAWPAQSAAWGQRSTSKIRQLNKHQPRNLFVSKSTVKHIQLPDDFLKPQRKDEFFPNFFEQPSIILMKASPQGGSLWASSNWTPPSPLSEVRGAFSNRVSLLLQEATKDNSNNLYYLGSLLVSPDQLLPCLALKFPLAY